MDDEMRSLDEYSRRLQDVRYVLEGEVIRYERDLRNVHFYFIFGLGAIVLGLSFLWIVAVDVTLFVIGRIQLKGDPLSFGLTGILSFSIGLFLLLTSIYFRIIYPSRIRNLKDKLEKLDVILMHPQAPAKPTQVLEDFNLLSPLTVAEKNRLEILSALLRAYASSVITFIAGLAITATGIIEGFIFEASVFGGIFILLGAVQAVWIYIKKGKEEQEF